MQSNRRNFEHIIIKDWIIPEKELCVKFVLDCVLIFGKYQNQGVKTNFHKKSMN